MCGYREGGGKGASMGARIAHLVSRHVKAEFCVVTRGGGGQGGANITLSEQICQS